MDNATRIGIASFEETRKVQAVENAEDAERSVRLRLLTMTDGLSIAEMLHDMGKRGLRDAHGHC